MSETCPGCGAELDYQTRHPDGTDGGKHFKCGSQWYPVNPPYFCESNDCLRRQLAQTREENERLKEEKASLHIALFHVENGLAHPDPAIRGLIKAAEAAKEKTGEQ